MARVERGNVVLYVKDEEIQHYIALGYKQTDDAGNVLRDTIPSDVYTLQKAFVDKSKKIDELEAVIAKLTAELEMKATVSAKVTEESVAPKVKKTKKSNQE